MHQQLVASQNDPNRTIVDSQEIADLLARANAAVDALMPSEHVRLNTLYVFYFQSMGAGLRQR